MLHTLIGRLGLPRQGYSSQLRLATLASVLIAAFAGPAASVARAKTWDDIAPADLAATDSAASPGVNMEVLFSRHTLDESVDNTYSRNYVRAKIYTRKGVEDMSILGFTHGGDDRVTDLVARVVKPDGTAVQLKKSDFHVNTVWKRHGYEMRKTTFAFPNVQPGDIVEYKWTHDYTNYWSTYYRFYCQEEGVFVREFHFEVAGSNQDYEVIWANCKDVEYKPGTRKVVVRNVPPFNPEPHMPPESEFRGWIMIIFTHPYMRLYGGGVSWGELGSSVAKHFNDLTAGKKAIKAKAAELMADRGTPEQAVEKIYRFVQTNIRNLDWDNSAAMASAKKKREKADEPPTAAEVLKDGYGNQWDIGVLFAALVKAAGYEVRLVMNANREEVLDIHGPKGWVLADRRLIAVKIVDTWKYYSPGNIFAPAGLLDVKDEGAMTYVCDEKKYWWDNATVAQPDQTKLHRSGQFSLESDGTLAGKVSISMTGHHAMDARESYREKSKEDVLKLLRDSIAERLSAVELTDLSWKNLDDNTQPFEIEYAVRVPEYAEAVGDRLLFQINFFTANSPAPLPAETRRLPLMFRFAEEVVDDVQLTLPEGYKLDGATAPQSIGAADQPVHTRYGLTYVGKTRTLSYQRHHVFGRDGRIAFRPKGYATIQAMFNGVQRSDTHQLAIKRKAPAAPAPAPAAPPPVEPATETTKPTTPSAP